MGEGPLGRKEIYFGASDLWEWAITMFYSWIYRSDTFVDVAIERLFECPPQNLISLFSISVTHELRFFPEVRKTFNEHAQSGFRPHSGTFGNITAEK